MKSFYSAVFGWTVEEHSTEPGDLYMTFKHNNRDVAAAAGMKEDQRSRGLPPYWLSYIYVANADDSASTAKRLGAKALTAPFDVMELGRMAILEDPTGAVFAVWQAKHHAVISTAGEAGTLVWTELITPNAEVAGEFYSQMFGWHKQQRPSPWSPIPYTNFMRGGKQAGGMIQMKPEMSRAQWLPYFGASDVDATAAKVEQLQGSTIVPPSDVAGARFAIFTDPQGAMFGIVGPTR